MIQLHHHLSQSLTLVISISLIDLTTIQFMPLNGDIAGLMARTSEEQFPWFSPAGPQRGNILNTVKLAYNPNKVQRDSLYVKRINPVIFSPGGGFLLFGDKTGLALHLHSIELTFVVYS